MKPYSRILIFVFASVLLFACSQAFGASFVSIDAPEQAGLYEKFEITFTLDKDYDNPFDPAQIDARAEGASPSGRAYEVPAFYYQEFDRELVEGVETFTPTGDPVWKVRLAPLEKGTYSWSLKAVDADGRAASDERSFESIDNGSKGFVRVDPDNQHYLALDSGDSYVALGFNADWSNSPAGGFDLEHYWNLIAQGGGNWTRLWMSPYGPGYTIEWNQNHPSGFYHGLGRYNMQAAYRLDALLDAADQMGMRVQIALNHHSAFETSMWSSWADNPFNAANGGPLEHSMEYFTNPAANDYADRRLRYTVARWGYSTAVFAWELWNEVDLITGYDASVVAAWQADKSRLIRSMDPDGHLITTSYSVPFMIPFLQDWDPATIDVSQRHAYLYVNLVPILLGTGGYWNLNMPSIQGEIGIDAMGEWDKKDYRGMSLHNSIWACLASGMAGGAMNWWWDGVVDQYQLWSLNLVPSMFLEGEDMSVFDRRLAGNMNVLDDAQRVQAAGVAGDERAIIWVHDPSCDWWGDLSEPFRNTEGVRLAIRTLRAGDWWVDAWNTFDGSRKQFTVSTDQGVLFLDVPTFSRDVALKLTWAGGPPADDDSDDDASDDDTGPAHSSHHHDKGCGRL